MIDFETQVVVCFKFDTDWLSENAWWYGSGGLINFIEFLPWILEQESYDGSDRIHKRGNITASMLG